MANIKKHLNNIKNALFGQEVRGSIHDGIDAINKEVEGTTEKQNKLGEQFKNLVINEGNSNAEVAASRGSHDWLPDRLDNFDSQLEQTKNEEKGLTYNSSTVFRQNVDFSAKYFRIPFGCVTKNGVIIAGCDIRYQGSNDQSYIDIGIARSLDGGKTWQDKKVAMRNNNVNHNYSRVMDGTILYDEDRNRIYLLGNYWNTRADNWTNSNTHKDNDWDIKLCYSDDEGLNWSEPVSLRDLCPTDASQFIGGVGSGIKTSNGTLIFPIQLAKLNDNPYNVQSGIMYSTDGVNWSISSSYIPAYTSECNVFEYRGEIYINCRQEGSNKRAIYKTSNLGATWTYCPLSDNTPQPNACMGSTIKIHTDDNLEDLILFSCVNSSTRGNLTLKVLNFNDTKFNNVVNYYNKNSDGYSCLVYDKWNKKLYSIFETIGDLQFIDLTPSLQNCYLEKSKEEKDEQKLIENRLMLYISPTGSDNNSGLTKNNALRTFKKIPYLVNNKYESVWIHIDNAYTDDIRISNINSQVTLCGYNSDNPIILNSVYIRNCTSVNIPDSCVVNRAFSEKFVIAIENSFVWFGNELSIANTVTSEIFAYLSNASLTIPKYSDEHETKVIRSLTMPIDAMNYASIVVNKLPEGEIQFVDSTTLFSRQGGIDLYVGTYPGADVKVIDDGSQLIDNGIISKFLTRNISYNNVIKGTYELNSKLGLMGEMTSLLCKSRIEPFNWRFTTSEEIPTNTVLFKLPTALIPKLVKYLNGVCVVNNNQSYGVCFKIDVNGNVLSYGKIPISSEIVINTSYSLY